jgi:adenylosuccinate synthase
VVRHAARVNGLGALAITKLDTLTGLRTIKVCTAYRLGKETITEFPASAERVAQCQPVYEEYEGWTKDISNIRELSQLPPAAQRYLEQLERLTQTSIHIVSVGAQRDQTIILHDPFLS